MGRASRRAERERKAKAYRHLAKSLAEISDVYHPTPANIVKCVNKAQLCERNAVSSILSREELLRENSGASVPEELADKAIAEHFAGAGELYGTAAVDCVLTKQPARAFKYFRRAAKYTRSAAALTVPSDEKLLKKARDYREKAAILRQEVGRRSILRKKWSLGILGRMR